MKAVVKVPKPIQASIALFAAGVILPTFVQAWPAIKAVAAGQPAEEGVGYFGLLVAAVVFTVVCGINAVRGKTEADSRVEQILKRKTTIPLRSD